MKSSVISRFIQIGIIVVTVTLVIIRLLSKNFTLINLITCISLVVAVFILLLSVRSLVETSQKYSGKIQENMLTL